MMYSGTGNEPRLQFPGIVDHSTALMASYQIIIALLMRERFGIGQEVDVSLLGTASFLRYLDNLHIMFTGKDLPLPDQAFGALTNHYRCQDGQWLILGLRDSDWSIICGLLGHAELALDLRFGTAEERLLNRIDLISIFRQAFNARVRDEWLRMLGEQNLVACAINTPRQSFEDPQMLENAYVVNSRHPDKGPVRIPGFPVHFSRAEVSNNIVSAKPWRTYGYRAKGIGRIQQRGDSPFQGMPRLFSLCRAMCGGNFTCTTKFTVQKMLIEREGVVI